MRATATIEDGAAARSERASVADVPMVARVDILDCLKSAESAWRQLEDPAQLSTPYQRYDFLDEWYRHVGQRSGARPTIVVGRDADGRPLIILPLSSRKERGVQIARFLGGKHSTFNMPLMRREFAASATTADLQRIAEAIGRHDVGVDILAFTQQPENWGGQKNPMALLPKQPSINDCPRMTLAPAGASIARVNRAFRKRLRASNKKLKTLPGFRYFVATNETDVRRLLDRFFVLKPMRMATQKLPNVFAEPGLEEFIRAACLRGIAEGRPSIEIHAIECADEIIAIFAGVAGGQRFSGMFNTYTMSEAARHSPGLVLISDIIEHYAEQGYTSLDLGIGAGDYKRMFCKEQEPVFDSFVGLTSRGHLAATALSASTYVKRFIKQTPTLMRAVDAIRKRIP